MRKIFPFVLLFLIAGCGSGGSGLSSEVSVSDLPSKLQQDLVCYNEETDSNGNTTYVESEPAAKEITFTLNYSNLCSTSFSSQNQDLIFEGCTVSVTPISKLPKEMTSSDFLREMANEIACTADDVTTGGSGTGRISITAALVDTMRSEYRKYSSYAPFLYRVNVTFKFSSNCGDGTVERTISVPVEFSNFIENDNDLCQQ